MFEDIGTPEVARTSLLDKAWGVAEKVSPGVANLRENFRIAREGAEKTGMPLPQAFAITMLSGEQMSQAFATDSGGSIDKFLNDAKNLGKDLLEAAFPNKVGVATAGGAFGGGLLLTAVDAVVTKNPSLVKTGLYMAAGAAVGNRFES